MKLKVRLLVAILAIGLLWTMPAFAGNQNNQGQNQNNQGQNQNNQGQNLNQQ